MDDGLAPTPASGAVPVNADAADLLRPGPLDQARAMRILEHAD